MKKERKKIGNIPIDEMKQEVNDFINEVRENEPVLTDSFESVDNPEYSEATIEEERKVISYRKKDGTKVENVGFETPKTKTDELNAKEVNIQGGVATLDELNLTPDGMNEFQQALKDAGFNPVGKTDWSDATHVEIPKPRCAIINLHTDFNLSNLSKSDRPDAQKGVNYDIPVEVEFWDMQGNYFKKWSQLSAQGNSSFNYPKKAFAFKFYNEDPGAQDFNKKNKFLIKFGNWVVQNGYHCKAYYTDPYRGIAVVAYQLYDDMLATRTASKNRAWKKALLPQQINDYSIGTAEDNITELNLRYDTGARNFPDGFPVIAYQTHHVNNELVTEFYGIMSWQLKKDAANYMMDEESDTAIHIDTGDMRETGENGWWQAENPNWGTFEIRVPEKLICMDGSDYDGDFPAELIDSTSPYYNDNNKKHKKSAQVKAKIEAMRTYDDAVDALILGGATKEQVRAAFEEHFDMEETVDYAVHALVTANYDGFFRNRQWTTYDGVKWQVNPYDMDCVFGELPNGAQVTPASYSGTDAGYQMSYRIQASPFRHLYDYYLDDIKARYAQLRDAGVFTTKNIIDKLFAWINAVGYDNYKKEFERWPNCPCNKETVLNDGWALADNPFGGASNTYDANTEYHEGDEVVIAYLRFKATRTIQGVHPTQSVGHKENIYRVEAWLNHRFALLDAWLEYHNN